MDPFQWTCPYCGSHQVATDENFYENYVRLNVGKSKHGFTGVLITCARCVNPTCNDVTLVANFVENKINSYGYDTSGEPIEEWRLRPDSSSKAQPEYIPAPLREDYYEACLIRDKSPKASATLARRCLQGMIRDFCGISKARLIDEINELKKALDNGNGPKGVELETIEAIDAIRDIGNIGAHMERDINLIVEVDPGEAQALIELIEMLFDEWYVARHKREQKLAAVKAIAAEKKAVIDEGRAEIARAKAVSVDAPHKAE